MKKVMSILIALITVLGCAAACRAENTVPGNILVVYFSATGTTEAAAKNIAKILGADIFEIEPAVPYTSADLNYTGDCRANREQNDDSARPAIAAGIGNIGQYDAVFIGYPIWWGKAPKIIYTFLESYDLSGKIIVPFCTSGGSGINTSIQEIKALEPNAIVNDGRRIANSSEAAIKEWLDTVELPSRAPKINIENNAVTVNNVPDNSTLILAFYNSNKTLVSVLARKGSGTVIEKIPEAPAEAVSFKVFLWDMRTIYPISDSISLPVTDLQDKDGDKMRIKIGGKEFTASLENNETSKAFQALLPTTLNMSELNGNEKYCYLDQSLPANSEKVGTIHAGDIMLYGSSCIVIFYDTFQTSYSYTRIGHIDDISGLTSALGSGSVTVTLE